MKSWNEFELDAPSLANIGLRLLFQSQSNVGYGFLATLRKDGAPRLHPVCLFVSHDRLYVLIPPGSPKCSDLLRDGRFALQAFPQPQKANNEEFYLTGCAQPIIDVAIRQVLIADAKIHAGADEVLFELFLDRAMYTRLVNQGTPDEHPEHQKWRSIE